MKIVHILTNLGAGGIEHFVTQAAISQVAQHDVTVISLRRPEHPEGKAQEHKSNLEKAGIDVHMIQSASGLGMVALAFKLRRLLRKIDPDVVNAHSYRALLLHVMMGGNLMSSAGKWVYTHHTAPLLIRPALFRLLNTCVTQYIANSNLGAQTLKTQTRKPVDVIYHGVIFPDAPPDEIRLEPQTRFVVTTVGSLRFEKRHDRVLEIAALIRKTNPDVFARTVFQIVGGGPQEDDLKRVIAEMNLQDHVRLLGERSDVLALLKGSDAFLLTSDFEGVPISLVEAGWAGLPLISADAGGCREVFSDGKEGYLVEIKDIAGYASAVELLATSAETRQTMARHAQHIPVRFNMDYCMDLTDKIYEAAQGDGRRT